MCDMSICSNDSFCSDGADVQATPKLLPLKSQRSTWRGMLHMHPSRSYSENVHASCSMQWDRQVHGIEYILAPCNGTSSYMAWHLRLANVMRLFCSCRHGGNLLIIGNNTIKDARDDMKQKDKITIYDLRNKFKYLSQCDCIDSPSTGCCG